MANATAVQNAITANDNSKRLMDILKFYGNAKDTLTAQGFIKSLEQVVQAILQFRVRSSTSLMYERLLNYPMRPNQCNKIVFFKYGVIAPKLFEMSKNDNNKSLISTFCTSHIKISDLQHNNQGQVLHCTSPPRPPTLCTFWKK